MDIQVTTDHSIPVNDDLATHATSVVENALDHVREHVTRVEVLLSDENASKDGPEDKRCVIEASLEDHLPVAVTHYATDLQQSVEGAAQKLTRLLDTTLGRPSQPAGDTFATSTLPFARPNSDEAAW